MTHGHVTLTADVGTCDAFFELAADAKVTQLYFAPAVNEHVGGFYVAVHDTQAIFEVGEAFGH